MTNTPEIRILPVCAEECDVVIDISNDGYRFNGRRVTARLARNRLIDLARKQRNG